MRPLAAIAITASLLTFVGPPSLAVAQTSTQAIDLEQLERELRQELKQELKDELTKTLSREVKEEVKAELQDEASFAEPAAEDNAWGDDDWKWEEEKPEETKSPFSANGYFRFRYDFFKDLDLNSYFVSGTNVSGPFAPSQSPPVPICLTDPDCAADHDPSTLGGANIRLRLNPEFQITDWIAIKSSMDILDNLVLGSSPDSFPNNPVTPLSALSQTQIAPSAGVNSVWTDSIRVKRLWAEIMTPFGQLRAGRMQSHFGMGLLANAGNGVDNDYGDSNDRIMFATKLFNHYIVPAYDWAVSGPTSAIRNQPYGQPFDRDQRDDVDQYILAIARRDKPEEWDKRLMDDGWALNYGMYHVGRFQALDTASFYNIGDPDRMASEGSILERDAQAYAYSYWVRFALKDLEIEAEYAGIVGKIGSIAVAGDYGVEEKKITINQHAGAIRMNYGLFDKSLQLRLLVLAASGDSAPGWGIRPLSSTSNTPGQWDGTQAPDGDDTINNFRVDPDFIVDMIFWRELVGSVTDALVVRPGVSYIVGAGLSTHLDIVYSRALFAQSTPSGGFSDLLDAGTGNDRPDLGAPSKDLGVEFDFKLAYDTPEGFHLWFQYGLFVPLAGLDREVLVADGGPPATTVSNNGDPIGRLDGKLAQTFQTFVGVEF